MCDPSIGEQKAFFDAYELSTRLIGDDGISGAEVGKGFALAAVSVLRKTIGNQDTAGLLYLFADDYAVRDPLKKKE